MRPRRSSCISCISLRCLVKYCIQPCVYSSLTSIGIISLEKTRSGIKKCRIKNINCPMVSEVGRTTATSVCVLLIFIKTGDIFRGYWGLGLVDTQIQRMTEKPWMILRVESLYPTFGTNALTHFDKKGLE